PRAQQPRPRLARRPALFDRALRRIADEAGGILHLVHDLVAGIDTGAAANAHVLQPVADVDTRGAHLHAQAAIDAVAHSGGLVVDFARAPTARVAPSLVVSDHEGVRV